MTLDEKLVKEWSGKLNLLEQIDEHIERDPSNPAHIINYLLRYHNLGKPEEEQNTRVPPEAFKLYHPTYLRYEIAQEKATAQRSLVDEIKEDYKAGLNLVKEENLLSILEDIPPIKDAASEEIQGIHSAYYNLSQAEKLKDENAKINEYIKINGYKGKVAEIVREFYADHKGAINVRILQMKDEIRKELASKLKVADEIKNYIIANVDKVPEDQRDRFYLAIGKKIE